MGPYGNVTIHFPDVEHRVQPVGFCYQHEPYGDECFEGKVVVFTKWSDQEITADGTTITVIDERDVLAVFDAEV